MGKNKTKHIPNSAFSRVGDKKEVIIQELESPDKKNPSWRFGRFDMECHKWGMKTMQENLEEVIKGLKEYENLTWEQIKKAVHGKKGKTKNHSVRLDGLTKAARRRLSDIKNDDIAEVFSLRLNGSFRIIGIRVGAILYILWIDPNHEVCEMSH